MKQIIYKSVYLSIIYIYLSSFIYTNAHSGLLWFGFIHFTNFDQPSILWWPLVLLISFYWLWPWLGNGSVGRSSISPHRLGLLFFVRRAVWIWTHSQDLPKELKHIFVTIIQPLMSFVHKSDKVHQIVVSFLLKLVNIR